MLTEDNDPTKPAGVLDNAGNVSSSTEASVQHPRSANNGGQYFSNFIGVEPKRENDAIIVPNVVYDRIKLSNRFYRFQSFFPFSPRNSWNDLIAGEENGSSRLW